MEKKLHRIPDQAVFGGVAAGLSQYFQIDVVIIRVLFVVMLLLPLPPSFGWTGLIYLILWAVLPTGPAVANPNNSGLSDLADKIMDPSNTKKTSDQSILILGGALVFFGCLMLVDDLPFWYEIKRYFWPAALIGIGAFLILRQRDQSQSGKTDFTSTPTPFEPDPNEPQPIKPDPTEPDPVPYRPFDNPSSTPPTDQDNTDQNKGENDDDDQIIRVN